MLGDKSPGVLACGLELVGQSDQAIIRRAPPQSTVFQLAIYIFLVSFFFCKLGLSSSGGLLSTKKLLDKNCLYNSYSI